MKSGGRDRHKPLLAALQEAGLKVDEVVKQDKKTIITVSPRRSNARKKTRSGSRLRVTEKINRIVNPEEK